MTWEHGGRRSPAGLRYLKHTWMADGLCRGMDVNDFFDNDRHVIALCRRCPVATDCADYAWENGIEYGIFGGVTGPQRADGMRYMPVQEVVRVDVSAPAKRALELHRSGMRWRAITRATGVPARVLFKLIQQERAS